MREVSPKVDPFVRSHSGRRLFSATSSWSESLPFPILGDSRSWAGGRAGWGGGGGCAALKAIFVSQVLSWRTVALSSLGSGVPVGKTGLKRPKAVVRNRWGFLKYLEVPKIRLNLLLRGYLRCFREAHRFPRR